MEKESVKETATQDEIKRPEKTEKKETRFDRRWNWVKDHPVLSWLPLIAIAASTIWGLLPKPVKDSINNDISHIHSSSGNADADRLTGIVKNYFADLASGRFRAANYFAPHVEKYYLVPNTGTEDIDKYYRSNGLEFLNPTSEMLDSTISFSKDPSGDQTIDLWMKFACFRKSKMKYEYCLSREEFVFDRNNKIKTLFDIQHKDLKYYNKEILLEGSVGKLPAVFNLTFDYENQKISGTYNYPSRPNVTYRLEGTISGKKITLTEYTKGIKTATCYLTTSDNNNFSGSMNNTDGRQLAMTLHSSEGLFL
jgi:hypothetical protein